MSRTGCLGCFKCKTSSEEVPGVSLLEEETIVNPATGESLAQASAQPNPASRSTKSEQGGKGSLKMRKFSAPPLMDSACGEAMDVKEVEENVTAHDFLLSVEEMELKAFLEDTAIRPVPKKEQSVPLLKSNS